MTTPGNQDPGQLHIDGLLRELARHGRPGTDEDFVSRVMQVIASDQSILHRHRRIWLVTTAAAAALLVSVLLVQTVPGAPVRLIEADQLSVQREGRLIETWRLRLGDVLLVPNGGNARLRWGDGTEMDLVGPASASLPPAMAETASPAIRIETGRARFRVAAQAAGAAFVVITRDAAVAVEGTVFEVDSGMDRTSVVLREGAVRVRDDAGREVRLMPGEEALAPRGGRMSVQVAEDAAAIFRERFAHPGSTWRGRGVDWERRWTDVERQARHVLAVHSELSSGELSLPLPKLPDRLRIIAHLRAARIGDAGSIAIGADDGLDLTAALAGGNWTRVHLRLIDGRIGIVGDATAVARWPTDGDFRLRLNDVDLDITDVVLLPEEKP